MTEHKMWAVVAEDAPAAPFRSIETTRQGAKNTALAMWEPMMKWSHAKRDLGWRVVPVTVIVPDEEQR